MQGVLLVHLESREQRESQGHWAPQGRTVAQVLPDPLETGGQLESWDHRDPKASVVTQERRVSKDQLVWQVKGVPLEKMGRSGPLVHLAHLVSQVTEESRDLQV